MSKALDSFEWLCENDYIDVKGRQEDVVALDCINSIEKSLKALEIIKEKEVDIWLLNNSDYENYIRIRKCASIDSDIYYENGEVVDNSLTKEEYDFLTEVFKNE